MTDTNPNSIEIPWEVVLFIFLFAVVLFYFAFFQQYLTALIWKLFMRFFLPKNLQVDFKRVVISIFSGHLTMFDVTIITQDMSFEISKISCRLFYWKKIIEASDPTHSLNQRMIVEIYGLNMLIYNRTWSTDLVENVVKMVNEGKSTEEITQYISSLYPEPQPYQLSILLRMILPLQFQIYAVILKIGNPRCPSLLIFESRSISGYYTIMSNDDKKDDSFLSYFDFDMNQFSLTAVSLNIEETEWYKHSMRNIYSRSKKKSNIISAKHIDINITYSLYGLYIVSSDQGRPDRAKTPQIMKININFYDGCRFFYDSYIDKLRRFFMEFYAPFLYNDNLQYSGLEKRIKYWKIEVRFMSDSCLFLPFVTDSNEVSSTDKLNNNNNQSGKSSEKRTEILQFSFNKDSIISIKVPQYVGENDKNEMKVKCFFQDIKINRFIPNQIEKERPIIKSNKLDLNVIVKYPEQWNGITQVDVFSRFQFAEAILAPYHIDFFTQFGTDWASWYPYQKEKDSIFNFFPYSYHVTVLFDNSIIKLFSETHVKYEMFNNPNNYPHVRIRTKRIIFDLCVSFTTFNEEKKSVTFATQLIPENNKPVVKFYLPENHMYRIRRGNKKPKYDYITMDNFRLAGSYSWNIDPHADCVISVNIVILNASGLLTITTLVTLVGTIANYTSRDRLRPVDFKETPPNSIFDYINNSNVTVSIDKGSIKIPLDLYTPTSCVIAHATGVFIGVSGYHPFWHVIVDIKNAMAELPNFDFPYEQFFNENFADIDGPKQGKFHVDYVHITMKTLSMFTGFDWHETECKVMCDIGRIDGYALASQLMSGLEIAWNIIHEFFSDDQFPIEKLNPFSFYKVNVYRVSVGPIHAFLDMGTIGLVAAMLPGGVVVYADTLINDNSNYTIFVHLPSIDGHLLQADPKTGKIRAILRASTYLNVVRDVTPDDHEDDAKRQIQILNMFDITPNIKYEDEERDILHYPKKKHYYYDTNTNKMRYDYANISKSTLNEKKNFYSYLYGFFSMNRNQINEEEFLTLPQMMRPETYHSSLDEEYEISQVYLSDPTKNDEFSLPIPELHYKSYKSFINMDDGILWLHKYETFRFYTHLSSSRVMKLFGKRKITPPDPNAFSKSFFEEDEKRRFFTNGAIRLIFPNQIIAQIRPEALVNVSTMFQIMNRMPDEQLMAKVVRSVVGDEYDLKNYHTNTINVVIPQVCVYMTDPLFDIILKVDSVGIRFAKVVRPNKDVNITVYIKAISLACAFPESEHASIQTTIPEIKVAVSNDRGAVKIDPINLYFMNNSPKLINSLIQTLSKYLDDFTIPSVGDRVDELVRIIKSRPEYKTEFKDILKRQYEAESCNTRYEANCELSAMYSTLSQLQNKNYFKPYILEQIPPKSKSKDSSLRMKIMPPPIYVLITHRPNVQSSLNLQLLPVNIESNRKITAISFGIQLMKIDLADDILLFVKEIIPQQKNQNKGITKSKNHSQMSNDYQTKYSKHKDKKIIKSLKANKSKKQESSKTLIHLVINNVSVSLNQFSLKLEQLFLTANMSNFSISASFANFGISINEWVKILLNGISIIHDGETNQGFVHIKPITVFIFLHFVLNLENFIDPKFLEMITNVVGSNESQNEDIHNFSRHEIKYKSHKHKRITNLLSKVSTSILIDDIHVVVAATEKIEGEIIFPKTCSFMHSSIDSTTHLLCYLHQPNIAILDFSFPLPNFLFMLELRKRKINAHLIIGDIVAEGKSQKLSKLASILNEVLATIGSKQKNVINIPNFANKTKEKTPNDENSQPPDKSKSNTKILFNAKLPKFEVKFEEISTIFSFNQVLFEVELQKSQLNMKFSIKELLGNIFNSTLKASVQANISKMNQIYFKISHFEIDISHEIITKIHLFAAFVDSIVKGFHQQENVNSLILQINDHIQQAVENRADQIFDNMQIDDKPKEDFVFPNKVKSIIMFLILNIKISFKYPTNGSFITEIPEVSLVVQAKESEYHQKIAIGAQFTIQQFGITFDTKESYPLHSSVNRQNDQMSFIHISYISISAINFLNNVDFDVIIDGFHVEVYPTILYAVSKIFMVINTAVKSIESTKKKLKRVDSLLLSPSSSSKKPFNDKQNKTKLIQINGLFRCIKTEIILSPISNTLPVPSIEITLTLLSNTIQIIFNINNKIAANFTPALISWLTTLKSMIPYLVNNIPTNTNINNKNSKIKSSRNIERKNSLDYNFNQLESPKKDKTPFPDSIQLMIMTKEIEVCFGCQPRRNDISCLVGISNIFAVGSTYSNEISIIFNNIYLHTHNAFSIQTTESKTSRLFDFNIPRIDASIGIGGLIALIEKIFVSFSSDKIEEISLFSDIWFQPILKLIKNTNYNDNDPLSKEQSIQNESISFKKRKDDDSEYEEEEEDNENEEISPSINSPNNLDKTDTNKRKNFGITLSLPEIQLFFNYASGAGNLNLTLNPIHVSIIQDLIFATINTISMQSAGQLICKFDVGKLLFISSELNKASMNFIQLQTIFLFMSLAKEPFLSFQLSQTHLLCRFSKEENSTSTNTILQLSIDSPDIKLTALTIPNLKTFIKTISDPIIAGVARANRSDTKPKQTKQLVQKYIPLFANLDVVLSNFNVILLRYDFKDNDAISFLIKAAMLHLKLRPEGSGMNRSLDFHFLPITLQRLMSDSATNEMKDSYSPKKETKIKPNHQLLMRNESFSFQDPSFGNENAAEAVANARIKASLSRAILKLPKVDGILETRQSNIKIPDIDYNFITQFHGNIEPSLNLSDYEMLVALIKYTAANIKIGANDDDSINEEMNEKQKSPNKSHKKKHKVSSTEINENELKDLPTLEFIKKVQYNFRPQNYVFAPAFKVGIGASINPDISWLLARFGISDEHIIPASLFEFGCIGLETFLQALTKAMTETEK